jgi:predicted CXXCH cytochrome family protein
MTQRDREYRIVLLVSILCLCSIVAAPSARGADLSPEVRACLECHGQRGLTFAFASGETVQAYVDPEKFSASMHQSLTCSSCHEEFTAQNHPQRTFKSRDQYSTRSSAVCRQCHTDDQLKRSSIHATFLSAKGGAPACTNCHNPHTITSAIHGKQSVSENDYCLGCHQHAMGITLRNKEHVSLKVDAAALEGSVHAKLACFDCHFGFSSTQHPKRNFNSARDFSIAQSEACRRCHFDKYTKTLESIHYAILSRGNLKAPVCTDCHGSHTVVQARADKLKSSKRCGRCHTDIFATYTKSIHGTALVEENNFDVPICTDCHTAHTIMGAHSQDYTDKVPEICGKCHSDATLMKKYGLYPGVVNSYLQDFHGVTLKLYQRQKDGAEAASSRKSIATCVDCHGIHDITKTTGPTSNLVKSRLVKRCQKCHPGATEEFPNAWLSHYEPSLSNAPLVFLINLTYKIFIPFMLIGLILQILLHIWRYAVNR